MCGTSLEASYALASGAREVGNPYDCTCQLLVKSRPQDKGDGHEIQGTVAFQAC